MSTVVNSGVSPALKIYSAALFASWMQKNTRLKNLSGTLPTQPEAEGVIRNRTQSTNKMPIVLIKDLTKEAGDEITVDLVQPYNAYPIMGDEVAEGRGGAIRFGEDRLRINQARFPIDCGGVMSQQRTKWNLRTIAKAQIEGLSDRFTDQTMLTHLSGARGFHNNVEWAVPLAAHPDFNKFVVNPVRAPSRNRHFLATAGGIKPVSATGNVLDIATTDAMGMDQLDAIRTLVETMPLPPPPVQFEGDMMANDDPIRVLLVSADTYTKIIQSTNTAGSFRNFQANAYQRAPTDSKGTKHPLFMGDVMLWNGILVVRLPKPIRFYAGNVMNWCADVNSSTETTTDTINANFNVGGVPRFAVDRSILLGGQALAMALGGYMKSGLPFFWSEKDLDHDNRLEILGGMINGLSKIRFAVDYGDGLKQPTDHGVIAIDSAVPITGLA